MHPQHSALITQHPKITILTGAGISAESGLATFRDSGGLWEGYRIEDVATPEAWRKDQELVLEFYNMRRKAALNAQPNAGHLALVKLEEKFDVTIVTQNVDNLHEKAGSSNVIHLHGELFKSRSTIDPRLVYEIQGWELKRGDKCEKGSQLRPHIVWFGEAVPMMDIAVEKTIAADIFIVVGTSLQVYPAAGLLDYIADGVSKYVIDPNLPSVSSRPNLHLIQKKGSVGMDELVEKLMKN
jgi:NAD-dependent deacetylase